MDYDLTQVTPGSEELDYLEWDAPADIYPDEIDLINLYWISFEEIVVHDLDEDTLREEYLSKVLPEFHALTKIELEHRRRVIAMQSSELNEGSPVRILWDEWAIEHVLLDRKFGVASVPTDTERDAKILQHYDRCHFERINVSLTHHNSDLYTGLKPGHPLAGYLEQKQRRIAAHHELGLLVAREYAERRTLEERVQDLLAIRSVPERDMKSLPAALIGDADWIPTIALLVEDLWEEIRRLRQSSQGALSEGGSPSGCDLLDKSV